MYYCGIDVAKRSHAVIVIDEQAEVCQPVFKIRNEQAGFAELLARLQPFQGQIQVGLESTGHYWLALYAALRAQDYPVTLLNPLQIHAYRKIDLRKRKTDKLDAFWIADFLRFAQPAPTSPELPQLLQLRELARFRFRLTQQIGDCKRKMLAILDRVFPEYEQLFSDVFLQSSRALLHHAVTAEDFADFDLAELEALLTRVSRGRFRRAKAEEIQALAQRSVGVAFLADAIHLEMRCLLAQVALLEQQRQAVEDALGELMAQLPQHITTIPGVGLVTGAMMLGEIGDVHRFERSDKLVAYAGIDPSVFDSGEFSGDRMRMSKRGSPYLRYALWQAAVASLLHNAELKAYYDKKRAEGKPHGVAVGAVCRKLLVRIYWVLKEQRPYVIR